MKVLLAVFEGNEAAVIKLFRSPAEDPMPYMRSYLVTWQQHYKVPIAFKTYEFHEGWVDETNWVAADPNPLMVMVYPVIRDTENVATVHVLGPGNANL